MWRLGGDTSRSYLGRSDQRTREYSLLETGAVHTKVTRCRSEVSRGIGRFLRCLQRRRAKLRRLMHPTRDKSHQSGTSRLLRFLAN